MRVSAPAYSRHTVQLRRCILRAGFALARLHSTLARQLAHLPAWRLGRLLRVWRILGGGKMRRKIYKRYLILAYQRIHINSATTLKSSSNTFSSTISSNSLLSGERMIFLCCHVPSSKYFFSLLYRLIVNF